MTANDHFDRVLQGFLETAELVTAPAGLHDDVIERARRSRQRPGWLVGLRGGTFGISAAAGRRPLGRVGYLLIALALVLAAFIVAIVAGAFRKDPINPLLGRNGAIVYGLQEPFFGMHVVGPDGSGQHDLAGGSCPVFSPDGSVLAYWAGSGLVVAAADGSSPRLLSIRAESAHPEDLFALSPDGTQIAWIRRIRPYELATPDDSTTTVGWDDELWVIPVSGGAGSRVLPTSGARDESRLLPAWSPNGRRIAYSTFVTNASVSHRLSIDVIDVDGSNQMRLTSRPTSGQDGMAWSPDSRFIAYAGVPDASPPSGASQGLESSGDGPPQDIFVIGADGTADRNLTNTAANEFGPRWSPDGVHLAYLTFVDGQPGPVISVRMNGSTPIGLPAVGPIVPEFVSWSPDGRRLLLVKATPSGSRDRGRTTRSTVLAVGPEFQGPSETLVDVDYLITCSPSWQRLDP